MTKLCKWVVMVVFAGAAFAAFGALDYGAITVEKYPDADAVLVDSFEETRYKPNGSYESVDSNWIKILTEKGRREESVLKFSFNARYGTVKILDVKVTGADGTERVIDFAKLMKESTNNSSVSENIYDPMDRQLVCAIPGLKVGDVLFYRVRRTGEVARAKDLYANISVFEWTYPIVRQTVRIIAPKERPLKRMAVRNPLGNVKYTSKTLADGSVEHTWVAKDSPQAFSEPDTPPLYTLVQNLYVSTAEDWPAISKWYWGLCEPHLSKTTPAITNQVNEIIASVGKNAGNHAKISAIYKWVAQEIRYMGLTMEETSPGYAPHDVNITFENRYGVCRDKAALLAVMLRIAGFEAYPVLIHAGAKMDNEVPLPYFNHAITAVRAPGEKGADKAGYILMDPTDESSRDIMPAYLGDRSYLVATPFGETLHVSSVPPADANGLTVESDATVEKDGSMLVKSTVVFKGLNDNAYRQTLLRTRPDDRRRFFERVVRNSAPGAELLSVELKPADLRKTEETLSVELLYRVNEAVLKGESREELQAPQLSRVMGVANWLLRGSTSLRERRFPLIITATAKTSEKLRVNLGDAIGDSVFMPENIDIKGPYSFKRTSSVKDGVLTMERDLAINEVEFSPAEYKKLLESLKRVEAAERERPVFARKTDAGANVHYLDRAIIVNVTSPTSWVATNVVEKKILTYDGKKKSAELTYSYNPSWMNVEVVSATVTNPDGTTASVSDHEKTVLDCGWASSAPRYPASKSLIVNLPSVEIGSVIKYVTVTTVTNAPAPFYSAWNFNATEPVDSMTVDYRDWKGGSFKRTVKNLKRVAEEPMQAPAYTWCDVKTVSHGDFAVAAGNLLKAAEVEADGYGETLAAEARSAVSGIKAVRDWMARHIRIVGPGLYDVPLASQMTDPATVLKERYASRFDYTRTMCALMKGAGFDADIVFVSGDAKAFARTIDRDIAEYPNIGKYSVPLCRVTVKEGGFLGLGGCEKVYYIGTENEYTPVEATGYYGSTYLDPELDADGFEASCMRNRRIALTDDRYESGDESSYTVYVRENGTVDIDYSLVTYGAGTGAFRKRYSEMLPEDRSRHFQGLLGAISQGATATRGLVTDVKGYPSRLTFSAYVPDYAVVAGDSITVNLPAIGTALFSLTGVTRETALFVPGKNSASAMKVKVVLPEGYTEIEHLPDEFSLLGVRDLTVGTSRDDKGRLVVEVVQSSPVREATSYDATEFARLKDYSRIASSRANRTIVVRRKAR